jgi:RNA polymerase sigma-70 factor, ECF subfamily
MDTSSIRLAWVGTLGPEATEQASTKGVPTSPADLSDEGLLLHANQADGEALAVLFKRHARLVRAIAFRILHDASEADDLLQEVFLFIHRKSKLFDEVKSSARSWIVQVTYHRAIDRLRYLQSRHFYSQVDLDDVTSELGDTRHKKAIEALEQQQVRQLFESLSPNQRHTIQLFFYEGFSFDEIAVKLGQTRGNVKNHYFRGLDKLRKQLLDRNPAPDSGV